jgi:hypothetical protein
MTETLKQSGFESSLLMRLNTRSRSDSQGRSLNWRVDPLFCGATGKNSLSGAREAWPDHTHPLALSSQGDLLKDASSLGQTSPLLFINTNEAPPDLQVQLRLSSP